MIVAVLYSQWLQAVRQHQLSVSSVPFDSMFGPFRCLFHSIPFRFRSGVSGTSFHSIPITSAIELPILTVTSATGGDSGEPVACCLLNALHLDPLNLAITSWAADTLGRCQATLDCDHAATLLAICRTLMGYICQDSYRCLFVTTSFILFAACFDKLSALQPKSLVVFIFNLTPLATVTPSCVYSRLL